MAFDIENEDIKKIHDEYENNLVLREQNAVLINDTKEIDHSHRHSSSYSGRYKKDTKNYKLRTGLSYIMSFLLAVFLSLMTYAITLEASMLNDRAYIFNIKNSSMIEGLYNDFQKESKFIFDGLLRLDSSCVENIVSYDTVYYDVIGVAKAKLNDKTYKADIDAIKNVFVNNCLKNIAELEESDPEMAEQIEANREVIIDHVYICADEIGDVYQKMMINTTSSITSAYLAVASAGASRLTIIAIFAAILSACAIVFIYKLYKHKHRALRFIFYSTAGTSVMTLAFPLVLLLSKFVRRVNITPDYVKDFLVTHFETGLKTFIFVFVIWVLISACLLVFIKQLKEKYLNRR